MARLASVRFVDLESQHREIRQEVDDAISRVFAHGHFILGSEVEAFENELASYCGVTHAIGTNSGTSALHLALLAAGIGPGDEVITVSLTFWATIAAVLYTGATPVMVEVDPTTCVMDPPEFERAITEKTKAVMPVHLYGRCVDMDAIGAIARRHGLVVIEDAAQAVGSAYKSRRAGSLGDLACVSFYPSKNLGAIGEGGAVLTDIDTYADTIRTLRDHGSRNKYRHEALGYNYRLEAIQAAVLRVKLRHLERWNDLRRRAAAAYRERLHSVELLAPADDAIENHHIFPVLAQRRDDLRAHLHNEGIETGIHYPIPAHLQPAFNSVDSTPYNLGLTERICESELSLPMHAYLTLDKIEQVTRAIHDFYGSESLT